MSAASETSFQLRVELIQHTSDVRGVACSPSSEIATASRDCNVCIWDLNEPSSPKRTLSGHGEWVNDVIFLDSARICTACADGTIRIWDAYSAAVLHDIAAHKQSTYALSADSSRIISASEDKTARVWEIGSGKLLRTCAPHDAAVRGSLPLPDGSVVTVAADCNIRIWTPTGTGGAVQPAAHKDIVRAVALAPLGGFVTVSNDSSLLYWRPSGPGKFVPCTGILNLHDGCHINSIHGLSLDENHWTFVTSGDDDTARVIHAAVDDDDVKFSCVQVITHPGTVWDVKFCPNGDLITACNDGVARVFTTNPSFVADSDVLAAFDKAVASRKVSTKLIGPKNTKRILHGLKLGWIDTTDDMGMKVGSSSLALENASKSSAFLTRQAVFDDTVAPHTISLSGNYEDSNSEVMSDTARLRGHDATVLESSSERPTVDVYATGVRSPERDMVQAPTVSSGKDRGSDFEEDVADVPAFMSGWAGADGWGELDLDIDDDELLDGESEAEDFAQPSNPDVKSEPVAEVKWEPADAEIDYESIAHGAACTALAVDSEPVAAKVDTKPAAVEESETSTAPMLESGNPWQPTEASEATAEKSSEAELSASENPWQPAEVSETTHDKPTEAEIPADTEEDTRTGVEIVDGAAFDTQWDGLQAPEAEKRSAFDPVPETAAIEHESERITDALPSGVRAERPDDSFMSSAAAWENPSEKLNEEASESMGGWADDGWNESDLDVGDEREDEEGLDNESGSGDDADSAVPEAKLDPSTPDVKLEALAPELNAQPPALDESERHPVDEGVQFEPSVVERNVEQVPDKESQWQPAEVSEATTDKMFEVAFPALMEEGKGSDDGDFVDDSAFGSLWDDLQAPEQERSDAFETEASELPQPAGTENAYENVTDAFSTENPVEQPSDSFVSSAPFWESSVEKRIEETTNVVAEPSGDWAGVDGWGESDFDIAANENEVLGKESGTGAYEEPSVPESQFEPSAAAPEVESKSSSPAVNSEPNAVEDSEQHRVDDQVQLEPNRNEPGDDGVLEKESQWQPAEVSEETTDKLFEVAFPGHVEDDAQTDGQSVDDAASDNQWDSMPPHEADAFTVPEMVSEPVIPEAGSEPVIPEAGSEPVIPDAGSEPVIPETVSEPIIPEAVSEPIVPEADMEPTRPMEHEQLPVNEYVQLESNNSTLNAEAVLETESHWHPAEVSEATTDKLFEVGFPGHVEENAGTGIQITEDSEFGWGNVPAPEGEGSAFDPVVPEMPAPAQVGNAAERITDAFSTAGQVEHPGDSFVSYAPVWENTAGQRKEDVPDVIPESSGAWASVESWGELDLAIQDAREEKEAVDKKSGTGSIVQPTAPEADSEVFAAELKLEPIVPVVNSNPVVPEVAPEPNASDVVTEPVPVQESKHFPIEEEVQLEPNVNTPSNEFVLEKESHWLPEEVPKAANRESFDLGLPERREEVVGSDLQIADGSAFDNQWDVQAPETEKVNAFDAAVPNLLESSEIRNSAERITDAFESANQVDQPSDSFTSYAPVWDAPSENQNEDSFNLTAYPEQAEDSATNTTGNHFLGSAGPCFNAQEVPFAASVLEDNSVSGTAKPNVEARMERDSVMMEFGSGQGWESERQPESTQVPGVTNNSLQVGFAGHVEDPPRAEVDIVQSRNDQSVVTESGIGQEWESREQWESTQVPDVNADNSFQVGFAGQVEETSRTDVDSAQAPEPTVDEAFEVGISGMAETSLVGNGAEQRADAYSSGVDNKQQTSDTLASEPMSYAPVLDSQPPEHSDETLNAVSFPPVHVDTNPKTGIDSSFEAAVPKESEASEIGNASDRITDAFSTENQVEPPTDSFISYAPVWEENQNEEAFDLNAYPSASEYSVTENTGNQQFDAAVPAIEAQEAQFSAAVQENDSVPGTVENRNVEASVRPDSVAAESGVGQGWESGRQWEPTRVPSVNTADSLQVGFGAHMQEPPRTEVGSLQASESNIGDAFEVGTSEMVRTSEIGNGAEQLANAYSSGADDKQQSGDPFASGPMSYAPVWESQPPAQSEEAHDAVSFPPVAEDTNQQDVGKPHIDSTSAGPDTTEEPPQTAGTGTGSESVTSCFYSDLAPSHDPWSIDYRADGNPDHVSMNQGTNENEETSRAVPDLTSNTAAAYDVWSSYPTTDLHNSYAPEKYGTTVTTEQYSQSLSIMDTSLPDDGRNRRSFVSWGFGGSVVVLSPTGQPGTLGAELSSTRTALRIYDASSIAQDNTCEEWSTALEVVDAIGNGSSDLTSYANMCERLSSCTTSEGTSLLWRYLSILCRNPRGNALSNISSLFSSRDTVPMYARTGQGDQAKYSPLRLESSNSKADELKSTAASEVERLLCAGNQEEAIQVARDAGLWSLVLIISSSLSRSFFMKSVSDYARASLSEGTALQTLCLSISENDNELIELSSSVEGVQNWKKTLSVLLNRMSKTPTSGREFRVIEKMGDALLEHKQDYSAAHLCYIICGKLNSLSLHNGEVSLLGANPSIPCGRPQSFGSLNAILQSVVFESIIHAQNGQNFLHLLPLRLVLVFNLIGVGKLESALQHCNSIISSVKMTLEGPNLGMANNLFTAPFLSLLESTESKLQCRLNGTPETSVGKLSQLKQSLSSVFKKSTEVLSSAASVTYGSSPSLNPMSTSREHAERKPAVENHNDAPLRSNSAYTDPSAHATMGAPPSPNHGPSIQPGFSIPPSTSLPEIGVQEPPLYAGGQHPQFAQQQPQQQPQQVRMQQVQHQQMFQQTMAQEQQQQQQQQFQLQQQHFQQLQQPQNHFQTQQRQSITSSSGRSTPNTQAPSEPAVKGWNAVFSKTIAVLAPEEDQLSPPPVHRGTFAPGPGHAGPPVMNANHPPNMMHMRSASVGDFPTFAGQSGGEGLWNQNVPDPRRSSMPVPQQPQMSFAEPNRQETATNAPKPIHRRASSDITHELQASQNLPPLPPKSNANKAGESEGEAKENPGSTNKTGGRWNWRRRLGDRMLRAFGQPKQAHMGEKNKFVFDKELNRWVIPGEDVSDAGNEPPPPPDDDELSNSGFGDFPDHQQQQTGFGSAPSGNPLPQEDMSNMQPSPMMGGPMHQNATAQLPPVPPGPGMMAGMGRNSDSQNGYFADNMSDSSVGSARSAPTPMRAPMSEVPPPAMPLHNKYRSTGKLSGRRAYVDTFNPSSQAAPVPVRPMSQIVPVSVNPSSSSGVRIFNPGPAPVTAATQNVFNPGPAPVIAETQTSSMQTGNSSFGDASVQPTTLQPQAMMGSEDLSQAHPTAYQQNAFEIGAQEGGPNMMMYGGYQQQEDSSSMASVNEMSGNAWPGAPQGNYSAGAETSGVLAAQETSSYQTESTQYSQHVPYQSSTGSPRMSA